MADTELIYQSTKTYTHAQGFSCCFRQWRADSHCNKLHGYALQIELVFEGPLDDRNWVQDFGDLKGIKEYLAAYFDHKTLIARDDPEFETFVELNKKGVIDMMAMEDGVGAEKFAEFIFKLCDNKAFWDNRPDGHRRPLAQIKSVEVWEHAGNSAKVIRRS